jgi:hypothetical protein
MSPATACACRFAAAAKKWGPAESPAAGFNTGEGSTESGAKSAGQSTNGRVADMLLSGSPARAPAAQARSLRAGRTAATAAPERLSMGDDAVQTCRC